MSKTRRARRAGAIIEAAFRARCRKDKEAEYQATFDQNVKMRATGDALYRLLKKYRQRAKEFGAWNKSRGRRLSE